MAKQLELNFNDKSETLKKLDKEIPDFKKNGFETKEEFDKAVYFDREYHYMKKFMKGEKWDYIANTKGKDWN